MPDVVLQRVDEIDHRRQHQDAAERRVEDELERGVDAALAAPDADEQEHRDQHRFPEEVEQEQVLRDERAHHRELDQEHHRVEELHVLRDRGERAGDDQRAEERGQQHEQDVVAVEADLVVHAPVGDPRQPGLELQPGDGGVEPRVQHRRSARTAAIITASDDAAHRAVAAGGTSRAGRDAEQRQEQDDVEQAASAMAPAPQQRARRCRRSPRRARRAAGCRSGRGRSTPARALRRARPGRSACRRAASGRRQPQEDALRDPAERPAEQRSYSSSMKYLPASSGAARRSAAQPLRRASRRRRRTTRRRPRPASAITTESDEQRRLEARRSSVGTAGSGSSGSRKCGSAMKPPNADSTASTTSTPVIDSGDSWTWCSTSRLIRDVPKNVSHSRRNM